MTKCNSSYTYAEVFHCLVSSKLTYYSSSSSSSSNESDLGGAITLLLQDHFHKLRTFTIIGS